MAHIRSYNFHNGLLRKVWPLYRGQRAGKLVKSRETNRCQQINIVQPREIIRAQVTSTSNLRSTHNPTNCVHIITSPAPETTSNTKERPGKTFVPSILLSNVMSLAPKIDEVRHHVEYANLDLVCLTETWLQEHIHDNVVAISGHNLIRLDRKEGVHGGVCMFIKDSIQYSLLDDLFDSSVEVLWVKIRPNRSAMLLLGQSIIHQAQIIQQY